MIRLDKTRNWFISDTKLAKIRSDSDEVTQRTSQPSSCETGRRFLWRTLHFDVFQACKPWIMNFPACLLFMRVHQFEVSHRKSCSALHSVCLIVTLVAHSLVTTPKRILKCCQWAAVHCTLDDTGMCFTPVILMLASLILGLQFCFLLNEFISHLNPVCLINNWVLGCKQREAPHQDVFYSHPVNLISCV